ncbi:short-chain-enoyl-CoA hydratase [Megasphaera paucivorans]|uniref:Enoyl-CoA hydratase n=1 Tax=Megasphaera paucivorans TaxID=349095 RepID=A0A1G9ZWJ7_9FIRM|nr:short-chain-enoyl-CoA hydratase [Megasphaera paucivorans]SDN25690.1 enoyl-CoA hydratase [Megasphaera paucivorans]
MSYENLLIEKENGTAVVTINRPKALNALNEATVRELDKMIDEIEADQDVAVLIITGSGQKSFVAGADIVEMKDKNAMEGRDWGILAQGVFNKLENMKKPVIAAVNGYALGGGNELQMACDIRIAADNAKFGQPEVTLGITPGFGGTQRLPRLVSKGMAKKLLFTGAMIDAAEAYRIGLVDELVPADHLMAAAKKMAVKIQSVAPLAVQLCKSAVNRGINMDLQSGIQYEDEVWGLCFSTNDQKEGMQAFVEKRKAEFSGK